ncbi:MAG: inorganic phosphate transporter [Myxococcota bacterium]
MAWTIGANDVANAMGTSVGSGALTLRRAVIVAAIFELLGAFLVGGSVTETIGARLVRINTFVESPVIVAAGMTSCLIAASLWLHIATYLGWPVSTTHAIVGAAVGFGVWIQGTDGVQWGVLAQIVASWILSPLLGAVLGYYCFRLIRGRVLTVRDPGEAVLRIAPWTGFFIFALLAVAVVYGGLGPLSLDLSGGLVFAIAVAAGLAGAFGTTFVLRIYARRRESRSGLDRAERLFAVLQVVTACFVAFAHGSNDVANAVGPMAAVFAVVQGGIGTTITVPNNLLMIGAFGVVLGLSTYGFRVMETIGKQITELTPSRGFAAELAAASTITLASKLGLPVSTTHTIVGAVVGVALARSLGALNLRVIRGVVASWVLTVPFTAVLAAILVQLVAWIV